VICQVFTAMTMNTQGCVVLKRTNCAEDQGDLIIRTDEGTLILEAAGSSETLLQF
jgi:hypothetical protein